MKTQKSPRTKLEAVFHLVPRGQNVNHSLYLQGDQHLRIRGPRLSERQPTAKELKAAQKLTDGEAWHMWLGYICGDDYDLLCGGDLYVGWLEHVGELAGYGKMPDA